MKYSDVQKLVDAGFVNDEQRQKIIEHFKLNEDSNRFLVIISFVGAVAIGLDAILTALIFFQARKFGSREPEYVLAAPSFLVWSIIAMFGLGILWEIVTIFK